MMLDRERGKEQLDIEKGALSVMKRRKRKIERKAPAAGKTFFLLPYFCSRWVGGLEVKG